MPASKRRNVGKPKRRNVQTSKVKEAASLEPARGAEREACVQDAALRRIAALPFGIGLLALAAAHAILFVCAFPPVNIWPLAFIAPAPLAILALIANSTRRALAVVFIAQLAMWLWLDRWLIDVTIAGYPLKAAYMSIYACAFVWLIRRLALNAKTSRLPMAIVLPVVWVSMECLRGELVFDGYPWFLLAHPVIEAPVLAQAADLLGTYFVSFIVASVAGAIVDLVGLRLRRITMRTALAVLVAATTLQALNMAYGFLRLGQQDLTRPGPTVLLIQTNLPQSNKIAWTLEAQRQDVASFIELTLEAWEATGAEADLIVEDRIQT